MYQIHFPDLLKYADISARLPAFTDCLLVLILRTLTGRYLSHFNAFLERGASLLINLNNPRHQSRLLVIGVVIAVLTARLMDLLTVNNLVTNQIKNGALIIIGMGFLLAVYFSYRMKNGKYSRLAHKIPTKVQLITISFLLLLIIFMKQVILVIVSIPLTAQYTAITILMAAVIGSLAIIWREEE